MTRWNTLHGLSPKIIAHRGASGYRPEHTMAGYALAAAQGADVLEPDLVLSRDGVLFTRHDLALSRSTDIARSHLEFAARRREIAGVLDWWVSDFDAREIDMLRAIQPFPERGTQFDGQFTVPRFGQLLDFAKVAAVEYGRPIRVYPELKQPGYFRERGQDPVRALQSELAARGLLDTESPVWIQCFDQAVLREAKERCGNRCFPLLEVISERPEEFDALMRDLSTWASGVAPSKFLLWDTAAKDTGLVAAAHAQGLEVHAWTFREDRSPAPFATTRAELEAAFTLGVDALFCDFPDVAVKVRAEYAQQLARHG